MGPKHALRDLKGPTFHFQKQTVCLLELEGLRTHAFYSCLILHAISIDRETNLEVQTHEQNQHFLEIYSPVEALLEKCNTHL